MPNQDYIPTSDEKFHGWVENLIVQVNTNAATWNIDTANINALQAVNTTYLAAWEAYLKPDHGKATNRAKDEARDALKKAVRAFVNQHIRYNPIITGPDRDNLGLPIHDTIRTPKEDPKTRPEADIKHAIRQLTIYFRDEGSDKRGKPAGIHGAEILWSILDKHPTAINELVRSIFSTKSPYIFNFEENQRSKTFYCCLRWENGKGGKGPWSQIYSAIIP